MKWSDIKAQLQAQSTATKTLLVPLGGEEVAFKVRQIPQAEEDRISDLISVKAPKRKRGDPEISMNTAEVKWERWKAGVVSGPDGFDVHNRGDYALIPCAVRDEILDAIDGFSSLPDELRLCFRGRGQDGQAGSD